MSLKSDRPFSRQLTKLLTRIFLGGRRAHYHSWLPSLAVVGRREGAAGTVRYKGRDRLSLKGASELKSRAGSRVVIVGSGPSVKGQNLSILPPKSAVLLNGAISLIGQPIAEPLAVAIEDERFIWRHFDMVREKVDKKTLCLMSSGVIRAICDIDPAWFEGRSVILIDDIRKPYGAPRRNASALEPLSHVTLEGDAGFSADPDAGVFMGGSVVISALQFALATPATTIGFIGVDISNADGPRFYEDKTAMAFSGIAGAEARILAHIALAAKVAAGRGVALVNHSAVSALRSIGLDYRPLASAAS